MQNGRDNVAPLSRPLLGFVVANSQHVASRALRPGSRPHRTTHHCHSTSTTTQIGKAKGKKKTQLHKFTYFFAPEENSQPNIRNTRKGINRSSREEGKEDNKRSKWERLSKKSREAVDERSFFFLPPSFSSVPLGSLLMVSDKPRFNGRVCARGLVGRRGGDKIVDQGGGGVYWPAADVRDLRSRSLWVVLKHEVGEGPRLNLPVAWRETKMAAAAGP